MCVVADTKHAINMGKCKESARDSVIFCYFRDWPALWDAFPTGVCVCPSLRSGRLESREERDNMKRSIVLALCCISAPGAFAGDVDAAFLGTVNGLNVRTDLLGSVRDVFSGQMRYSLTSGVDACLDLDGMYITFCSEMTEYVSTSFLGYECFGIPANPFVNASPFNAARTDAVANLFAAYGDTAISTSDASFASAFQIAVWEIIYDFNPGVGAASIDAGAGDFKVTNTDTSSLAPTVSAYISAFAAAAVTPGTQNALISIRNEGAQDQIVLLPAPGSLALVGLAGVAGLRRRR